MCITSKNKFDEPVKVERSGSLVRLFQLLAVFLNNYKDLHSMSYDSFHVEDWVIWFSVLNSAINDTTTRLVYKVDDIFIL